jgi:putative two-component system hydrogenase maturation factor HypX/HoxX
VRILFLTHAFNSLTQRLYAALVEAGHEVSVEFDINDAVTIEAVEDYAPDLVIAPFLKRAIPDVVWRRHTCFVVHPGIVGDRGPSALDWAILSEESCWGVTVLQADAEMDAGDIWATIEFPMRDATKASLYRGEVTAAAVEAVLLVVDRYAEGDYQPLPLAEANARGRQRPVCRQEDRAIDWAADDTATVVRKIRSADGFPGLRSTLGGREVYLYDARPAAALSGNPGELVARSGPALGVATRDGGVWIGQLRDRAGKHPFKMPASDVLADAASNLPETPRDTVEGYREITLDLRGDVATIDFEFYNGAMSSEQCERLRQAFVEARRSGARVIVLAGGHDFWSNGMHLNVIEASASPADASWENINAIDDLACEIITSTDCITVAALAGNAGAGGVFLARAADLVWAHEHTLLNPHYKDMGNLYGSEYWTYLLPRVAGAAAAEEIMASRLPMAPAEAVRLGLVDSVIAADRESFLRGLATAAAGLAEAPDLDERLAAKAWRRQADEQKKPLDEYRREELERMRTNFYGFDPSYHVARYNFVYKVPRSRTPLTIARHRRKANARVRQAS